MIRLPPRPTRSDALVPSTTLFRSPAQRGKNADLVRAKQQEGEKILKALPRDALVIALDEHGRQHGRSEEHTYELQSLMRISYAVFCWQKTNSHCTSLRPIPHS